MEPAADGDGMLISFNPSTGEEVGRVACTPLEEIVTRVTSAREAQGAWGRLPALERAEILAPAGGVLEDRSGELASLLTSEMGKPLKEATGEVLSCGSEMVAAMAEIVAALEPDRIVDADTESIIHRDPLGVCAAITPWNFPMAMPHWLVLPALVAGNTVVLKPSEETPLIAQAYADILAGVLPPGVLQVIHGQDDVGRALVTSDVDLIAFTGSREAGASILGAAGPDLKRVILELGGKDPMIVLDDADLDAAASFAARNSFRNAGQVCVSTERIYVDAGIADDFISRVVNHAESMVVGDGHVAETDIGPMINARQRDHVLGQLEEASAAGATFISGDMTCEGNFIKPVILVDVDHSMTIMQEETFGPVACIMTFTDVDDAIHLANDTPFGLGASVFGRDTERASGIGRSLTAGMIGINKGCGGAAGTPWVGARQSGYGYHSGRDGHRQFTQPRVVSCPVSPVA